MTRLLTTMKLGLVAAAVLATALGTAAAVGDTAEPIPASVHDVVGASMAVGSQETQPDSPDFIDLAYYESYVGDGPPVFHGCETPEPGVTVCRYTQNGLINGTHVGQATEIQTGTGRIEQCTLPDGTSATARSNEAGGTITSESGDKLFFRITSPARCGGGYTPSFWTVIGGTGRFEDASGIMSGVDRSEPGEPFVAGVGFNSHGTLRVRADLYEEFLDGDPSPIFLPGVAAVTEGDEGQVVADVPVTLSFPASAPVTVDWTTLDTGDPGIATAGVDYVAASGTLTFAPGESQKTVSVSVNGDADDEPPAYLGEWGLIEFSNPSPNVSLAGGVIDGYGLFIIVDDD